MSIPYNENKKRIAAFTSGLNVGVVEDKNNNDTSNPVRRSFLVNYLSRYFDSSTSCNTSRILIAGGKIYSQNSSSSSLPLAHAANELNVFLSE